MSPAPHPAPGPDGDEPPLPGGAAQDGAGPGGAAGDGAARSGLGGRAFEQDEIADTMPPGPALAALADKAVADVGSLSDDALLGLISAGRRLANRAEYLELAAIAEFTARRQAQLDASEDRPGQRAGEFADAELGAHLLISGREAGNRMDQATALATRLPCTFAGLGDGTIDAAKG